MTSSRPRIQRAMNLTPEMADLLRQEGLPDPPAQALREWWTAVGTAGDLLGMVALEGDRDSPHLLLRSLAVSVRARGQGVGAALVWAALARAAERARTVYAATTTAEPFLASWGFARIAREAAPAAILATDEWRYASPDGAAFMKLSVGAPVVRVRRARPEDAEAVADIYNQGILSRAATFETDLVTAESRRQWIDAETARYPMMVGEQGGAVVGFVQVSPYSSRRCYAGIGEFSVYVDPRQHRQGIGRRLMGAICAVAAEHGFWKLVSRVFTFNDASRRLLGAAGFREVGVYERHAQLDGQWLDVVIVEKLLMRWTRPPEIEARLPHVNGVRHVNFVGVRRGPARR